jgi:hypothetical protein
VRATARSHAASCGAAVTLAVRNTDSATGDDRRIDKSPHAVRRVEARDILKAWMLRRRGVQDGPHRAQDGRAGAVWAEQRYDLGLVDLHVEQRVDSEHNVAPNLMSLGKKVSAHVTALESFMTVLEICNYCPKG